MSALVSPSASRLKSAVIDAVEAVGGIEAAAKVTGRGKSTTGRWHTINHDDLPTLDSALLLDRVSLARGGPAYAMRAMARELGLEISCPARAAATPADLLAAQVGIIRENADVQVAIAAALADNVLSSRETELIREQISELIDELRGLDRKLAEGLDA